MRLVEIGETNDYSAGMSGRSRTEDQKLREMNW